MSASSSWSAAFSTFFFHYCTAASPCVDKFIWCFRLTLWDKHRLTALKRWNTLLFAVPCLNIIELYIWIASIIWLLQFNIRLAAVTKLGINDFFVLVVFLVRFLSLYAAEVTILLKTGALSSSSVNCLANDMSHSSCTLFTQKDVGLLEHRAAASLLMLWETVFKIAFFPSSIDHKMFAAAVKLLFHKVHRRSWSFKGISFSHSIDSDTKWT